MKFEHPKFGSCEVKELTQRDMETFTRATREGKASELNKIEYDGFCVRRALSDGLFVPPPLRVDEVDSLSPGRVRWLSGCLAEAMVEALTVDPLSSPQSPTS